MDSGRGGGVLALVIASVLWGTTGTAATFFPDDVSPLAIGACTMGAGGILLFLASVSPSIGVFRDRPARRWVALGAIGVLVYPLAFYAGMDLAGVIVGNVVALGSGPIFAALLERLWERQPLSARWGAATGLALVGLVLLTLGHHPEESDAAAGSLGTIAGVALGLLAGFAYALYTYASSRAIGIVGGSSSRGVMGSMFGLGALLLLPVLLVTGAPLLQSPTTIGIAAYLAIGPMFVAYLLFGVGLRSIRSSAATTITLIEPVVATVLAVTVVGEQLDALGWVGLTLVLAGIVTLVMARPAPKPAARL